MRVRVHLPEALVVVEGLELGEAALLEWGEEVDVQILILTVRTHTNIHAHACAHSHTDTHTAGSSQRWRFWGGRICIAQGGTVRQGEHPRNTRIPRALL